jgi:hydrogenase maturation protease
VIGVGTEHRGDDRCGLEVVRQLRGRVKESARLTECSGDITELLDLWAGLARVIVVDAVRSGRTPGNVVRFEVPPDLPPTVGPASSHGLSLAEAIGLGRSLGRFPRRLVVYGIEAGNVAMGDRLSAAVIEGVRETVERVVSELSERPGPRPQE